MVNTFLVHPDFRVSAQCLDKKRLFKQCVEVIQIINVLEGKRQGFKNHPAVLQWSGYIPCLMSYFNAHLEEVFRRGEHKTDMKYFVINDTVKRPWFVDNIHFMYSHRAALKRKDPEFYHNVECPEVYLGLGYLWPTWITDSSSITVESFAKINKSQLNVKRCSKLLSSGKNINEQCRNPAKFGDFCGRHRVKE